jgi:hypothetical protein
VPPNQGLLTESLKLKQERKILKAWLKALSRISYIGSATCLLMVAKAGFAYI